MKKIIILVPIILIFCLILPLTIPNPVLASNDSKAIIVVEIKKRRLQLIKNGKVLKEYRVRVGKQKTPTPIGEGYIFQKRNNAIFRYQDPPNKGEIIRWSRLSNGRIIKIPYEKIKALGFRIKGYKTDKYSIHSVTDPTTIGKAISNGCIGMKIEDMLNLYPLVKKGTKIIIKS